MISTRRTCEGGAVTATRRRAADGPELRCCIGGKRKRADKRSLSATHSRVWHIVKAGERVNVPCSAVPSTREIGVVVGRGRAGAQAIMSSISRGLSCHPALSKLPMSRLESFPQHSQNRLMARRKASQSCSNTSFSPKPRDTGQAGPPHSLDSSGTHKRLRAYKTQPSAARENPHLELPRSFICYRPTNRMSERPTCAQNSNAHGLGPRRFSLVCTFYNGESGSHVRSRRHGRSDFRSARIFRPGRISVNMKWRVQVQ